MKRFLFLTLFLIQLSASNLYGSTEEYGSAEEYSEEPSIDFIQTLEIPRSSDSVELSIYKLTYSYRIYSNTEDQTKLSDSDYFCDQEELDLDLPYLFFSSRIENYEYKNVFFVVKERFSGSIVAQLSCGVTDNKEGFKRLAILSMGVKESYRRMGISKLLLKMCEKLATNLECDFIISNFNSLAPEAYHAFVKAGYSHKEYPLPPSFRVKEYVMYKTLTKKGKEFLSK